MNEKKQIAFVGLSVLESMGLRSVFQRHSDHQVEHFGAFREFRVLADRIDAYVVSSAVFLENLDYFLPRKQRVLVVSEERITPTKENIPFFISRDSDESEIDRAVESFILPLNEIENQEGDLSLREIEVLKLVASGLINKEIAERLCISVNTVITHRKNISAKLGIKSASGLSLYAMMNGLL